MAAACPWWAPPVLAVQFLTRLPVPGTATLSLEAVAAGLVRTVGWFPLVGALVGMITALVAIAATALWPVPVAVVLALAIEALVTGAFHEDAVADFCDGFGGGQSADDVRRIMKDSRIGAYGTVGLVVALNLRAALTMTVLTALPPLAAAVIIIAVATFGRLAVVAVMAVVRPAPGGTGLAKDIGSGIGRTTVAVGVATAIPGLLAFLLAYPMRSLAAVAAATLFIVWFRRLLLRRLGGSTGDCLGFAAYAGQLILLLAAVAR